MKNILTITILVVNLRGAPYGLTYDIYENYYDYEISDNSLGLDNNNLVHTPQFITQPLNVASSKYRLEDTSGGNYLEVLTTNTEDAGQYRCSVSAYNKREIVHQLRIRVKPEILTVPSGVVTVQEGDSLAVTCSLVRGSPQPVLRWGRCGGEVVEESSVLRLEEVERREAGCYQCLADNGYSQDPVTRDLTLIVQYPPSLEVERTEDSVESMTITCSVVARPFASVVLYRESIGGEREVLYSSSEEEGGQVTVHHHNEATVYSLHLQQLQLEDFGDYICLADSPLGHAEDRTTVAGWPRVTSVKISSDPAQSSCYRVSVQLDSQYRVHNVHLLYKDHSGGKTAEVNIPPSYDNFISHRQCNLTFSTNYSVEISSANSYGASGPVQYNFTTETQNIFNLPWSAANSLEPSSMIMLVLQLLLMIRTF